MAASRPAIFSSASSLGQNLDFEHAQQLFVVRLGLVDRMQNLCGFAARRGLLRVEQS